MTDDTKELPAQYNIKPKSYVKEVNNTLVKNNANNDTPTDMKRSKPNINFELTYFSRCNFAITLLNIFEICCFFDLL